MFSNDHDTIFALSSGAGRAAIAVLRLSGPGCSEVLGAIAPGDEFADRRAVLRTLRHPQSREPLDRALITRFQAPRSFTGEEMAEISVTGGRAVASACVKALALLPGLRFAEPGEFAWRAFMNGKIDLSEVEGIADLVEAETEAQRQQAQRIAGGALSRECEAIRTSLLEAVRSAAHAALERIDRALATADSAQRLREGFTVVIAGPPNVGKSTLMNALAGRDVAITSPIPGTTRDLIEVFLDLRGYPVILVDTAGIRDAQDPIEQEGVARERRRAESADLTLWLDDSGDGAGPSVASPILLVRTKIDLSGQSTLAENQQMPLAPPPPLWGRDRVGGRADHADNARSGGRGRDPPPGLPDKGGGESTRVVASANLALSAKTGAGIDRLLDAIADLAEERMSSHEPALLTLERHRRAFQDARQALAAALAPEAAEPELIAEDLRRAALAMDRIVGRIGVEDVLGEIFARLCVGK